MCWREFFFQHTLPDGGEQDFTQILYIYMVILNVVLVFFVLSTYLVGMPLINVQ